MAKEIKQNLKESNEILLDEEANILDKMEGIANYKSTSRVFSRRTNGVPGVDVQIVKQIPDEDRTFQKKYVDPKTNKEMFERTVIDVSNSIIRKYSKDQQLYIDASKCILERNVSCDYFEYVGMSTEGNPLFELKHLDVKDVKYKGASGQDRPKSGMLKPRINREDIERYIKENPTYPLSLDQLIGPEVIRKRTTRIVKKD